MTRFAPLLILSLLALPAARAEQPADVNYMLQCMGCHLPDGSGEPPGVPDIRGEMGCMLSVPGGREYLVQVPGSSQAPISDAELAAVVNYMLETFNADTLPADYSPLTEAEIAAWRDAWLPDVAAVRQELMARMPADCAGDAEAADGNTPDPEPSGAPAAGAP